MNSKKRILHINNNTNFGGQQQVFMNILKNVDRTKYDIDLAVYQSDGKLSEEIKKYNCSIFTIPSIQKHLWRHYFTLKKIIKEGNYDIVHQHASDSGILINLIIAKRLRIKNIILHSHTENSKHKFLHYILRIFIPFFCNIKIACSDKAGNWLFKNNYEVISNGIDVLAYQYDVETRKKLREKLQIKDSTVVIGHIGRFDLNKNQKFLIETFQKYVELNADSLLILVGNGPEIEKQKALTKKVGIASKTIFLGERNDTNELYNVFDIFALSSFYEGQGLVVLEALANGLNVICNENLPYIKNTIRKKLNSELWSKTMNYMDKNRRKYDLNQYSNKVFIEKIEKLYEVKDED